MLVHEASVPGKGLVIGQVVVVALVDGTDSFADSPSTVRLGKL